MKLSAWECGAHPLGVASPFLLARYGGRRTKMGQECNQCAQNQPRREVRAPLQSIVTSYPLEIVAIDFLSLGRDQDTHPYILVMTDLFTRFAWAVPTRDQTAQTTVKALWTHVIQPFGCPERLHSDRGAAFESALVAQLSQMYGCRKSRTTPYHPGGNGACERLNQTLLTLLNSLSTEAQEHWARYLPELVHAYNNTVHSSTSYTPFFLMFGRHARLPVDLVTGAIPAVTPQTLEGWVRSHHHTLEQAYRVAGNQAQRRQARDQTRYNRRTRKLPLLPGERVLIRNFRRRGRRKLGPHWGPQ